LIAVIEVLPCVKQIVESDMIARFPSDRMIWQERDLRQPAANSPQRPVSNFHIKKGPVFLSEAHFSGAEGSAPREARGLSDPAKQMPQTSETPR
jgi:hypothetical protein